MAAEYVKVFILRLITLRRLTVRLFAAICLASLGSKAIATEYNIHVGPSGWVPFVMAEREGVEVTHQGVMFDFFDQFEAAYPQFTRKPVLLTRKRVNAKMAKGEVIDVMLNSPLFVSREVLEHYRFTDTLVRTYDKVITRKEQKFQYKTPHDLIDKKIGTIRGYSYSHFDFLLDFDFFEDIRVDSHTQAIGMLNRNRIDAYIGNSLVSPLYIKQMGLDVSDFVFPESSLYEVNIAFAVNKRHPELYEKLNKFVVEFVADGRFDALLKSYLEKYSITIAQTDKNVR